MAEFKPESPKRLFVLPFDEGVWPTAVTWLGNSRTLVAANRNGVLLRWDLPEEPTKPKDDKDEDAAFMEVAPDPSLGYEGHTNGITKLASIENGKRLVSAGFDRSIRIWDSTAKPNGESEVVLDYGKRADHARRKKDDSIFDEPGKKVPSYNQSNVVEKHSDWINGLGLDAAGKRMITGDDRGNVYVWDVATMKPISEWKGYPGNWITTASLTADGKTAFVGEFCATRGSFDRPPAMARIYDVESGEERLDIMKVQFPKYEKPENSYGYATAWKKFVGRGFVASAFSPNGKLLAVGQGGETDKGRIHLIDTETGKVVRTVAEHRYGATDVHWSPDGKYVLSAGRDTTIQICKVDDGKEVLKLHKSRGGQFKDWIYSFALSPDQQHIAAADIAGRIQVWSLGVG